MEKTIPIDTNGAIAWLKAKKSFLQDGQFGPEDFKARITAQIPIVDFIINALSQPPLAEIPGTKQRMVKQTVTGDMGNCMSACIASVLGLTIDDVPNWHETAKDGDSWWKSVREWLAERGLGIFCITYDPETLQRIGGMLIVSGMSPRGRRHSTVWENGAMINDPHPDNSGVEPDTIDIIFPLNPASFFPH